jgi:glycosyltransferase involved in cell wall biosynthesis/Flp pilus assembly protein TadD
MIRRYLIGPVTAFYADNYLAEMRRQGDCLAFNADGSADLTVGPADNWEAVRRRLPPGWEPDFVALYLPYSTIPAELWRAPVPLVGLAADYHLQLSSFLHTLPLCDLVLTDAVGVEALARAGMGHCRAANLLGCPPAWVEDAAPANRDIDVLFVGNFQPAVQRQRLAWLGRLARLGESWRVLLDTGVHGQDYLRLLRRARIVFNRSNCGECNRRTFETVAASGGALLFSEEGNREVDRLLRPGREYVAYNDQTLLPLLEHYLHAEDERRAIAEAARARAAEYTFTHLWRQQLEQVEPAWPELVERARERVGRGAVLPWQGRLAQALAAGRVEDAGLGAEIATQLARQPGQTELHNALGLLAGLQSPERGTAAEAVGCFRRAWAAAPTHALAGLNLAEALLAAGREEQAAEQARAVLALLERGEPLAAEVLQAGHFPPGYDLFRVEWEHAAWTCAGQPEAEARARRTLLLWRLHTLLADLTGEQRHFYEAALARPDLPPTRAALGCALARNGQMGTAAEHLEAAVAGNPFDAPAARALHEVYRELGDAGRQHRLARDRRLLHQAAPAVVAAEPWFQDAVPVADELASIIILCCNQVDVTRACLESVLEHTRPPYELLLIDNGSSDDTPTYLAGLQQRPGPARVVVIRNESNRGFAAGCNQGLEQARGRFLVLLNNDTLVTAGWLDGLVAWAVHDWPTVGLVGPMTSWSSPPQMIPVDYRTPEELQAFAARRREQFAGQGVAVERLTGFCLLLRREVWEKLGGLDETFGVGFFEDDDLCLRARQAGFRLVMALNVFIHHHGNRTFQGLGLDARAQLQANFEKFRAKWGDEHCAGYRLPDLGAGHKPEAPAKGTADAFAGASGLCGVSLCMIVRNEERHLGKCLASVMDLVDEANVIDTGSTDRTREIALQHGARVFDFVWVDSFAEARNESIRHATGAWIFWLDADECLDEVNRERLRQLFANLKDENLAYMMRQFSRLEAKHAAAQVDQVRLFRNRPEIRWEYRVHEQILLAVRRSGGDVRHTDIVIDHAGFSDAVTQGPKVDRNLLLLELELAEHPDDAFVLYNLGAVKITQGQATEALELFRRSLMHSQPGDVLVRKLHALIVRAHSELGQATEALAACRTGLAGYPDDGELLFRQAVLLHQQKDLDGASACLERILRARPPEHFTCVDAGLYGYRSRCLLAEICRDQGRLLEAEAHWRRVVEEYPEFAPAWLDLARLYGQQGRWDEVLAALAHLGGAAQTTPEALVLRGRVHLAREEFAAAREYLQAAITAAPQDIMPRVFLTHALLKEGKDLAAAEQALLDVLALDPGDREAMHNLRIVRQQRSRPEDGPAVTVATCPSEAGELQPFVSVCIIARNEEKNLPSCLQSVAGLAGEVNVVDTGSSDRTRDIAREHGARVFDFPWIDHFAAARNECLRHARGRWIFWMDCDDRLDEENRARLQALFASLGDEDAAYVMKCLCLPGANGLSTAVDHLRLFRNHPGIRWTFRVHEQVLPAVRALQHDVRWSDVVIHHTGYQDPALRQRKLQRDLRLLQLELAEQPEHAFTLFNLGSVYQELGRTAEALGFFRRSLAQSAPTDSIVRKLYALIAQCQRGLGQKAEALETCCAGRELFADDLELLFQEALARRALGETRLAIALWEQCLVPRKPEYFASVNTGLGGHITRHNLAGAYFEMQQPQQAEHHWREALAERPHYELAWRGLGDLYLEQQRWPELEALASQVESDPHGALAAACWRARAFLARKEFAGARQALRDALVRFPHALELRLLLSYALLQEGRDWREAAAALRDVLALDPGHAEARHNLTVLLRENASNVAGQGQACLNLVDLYLAACLTPSDIHEHLPVLYFLARQCDHVTEMGTRTGVSTTALLFAQPGRLVCYDRVKLPTVGRLEAVAGRTEFHLHEADVLEVDIEETDLLFIDTWHVYEQLKEELRRHAGKVRRYIVLHDTTTFGERGEAEGRRGLWAAVEEFLAEGRFGLRQRLENNNGLTVLERNSQP